MAATGASVYSYKYFAVQFPAERPYVAHVEINRPEKLNAFIEPMWFEMRQVFDQLSSDSSVRAIVLTGAGSKAFTAGLDVKQAPLVLFSDKGGSDTARKAVNIRRYIHQFQDCLTAIERCEKPVIAAMHGYSYGFAIDLSAAADVRICTRDVHFSVKEVDIGMAADIGVLSRLPKIVGNFGWVKEVALSARIFGAEEAHRVGFVNSIHDSKEAMVGAALDIASLIAQKSPVAVQGTKELLNWSRDHPIAEGLRYTAVWNSAAIQTGDVSTALMAGIEKRTPTFEKL
ncbi:ClpP/crotonase-like domain-containing protein [Aspergillus pseudocaelatus]|uniref:ClpP/crotonase-like domain-containing protein n=1 Tax=Aspergillus pseudocaelatus TaxID=1825620 RepID=A0ABQ6WNA7_9EURO|nr:ClpP/crotonase-like domain-containing protein [Aspergillus pseudocaelatus]